MASDSVYFASIIAQNVVTEHVVINQTVTGTGYGGGGSSSYEHNQTENVILQKDSIIPVATEQFPTYGAVQFLVTRVSGGMTAAFTCAKSSESKVGIVHRQVLSRDDGVDEIILMDWPAGETKPRLFHSEIGTESGSVEYQVVGYGFSNSCELVFSENVTLSKENMTPVATVSPSTYGSTQFMITRIGGGITAAFICAKSSESKAGTISRSIYSEDDDVDEELMIDWPTGAVKPRLYHSVIGSGTGTVIYKVVSTVSGPQS
jgi:hypothetical protein